MARTLSGISSQFLAVPCGSSNRTTFSHKYHDNILSSRYANFTDPARAIEYVTRVDHDVVIKASGLAAGKGLGVFKFSCPRCELALHFFDHTAS